MNERAWFPEPEAEHHQPDDTEPVAAGRSAEAQPAMMSAEEPGVSGPGQPEPTPPSTELKAAADARALKRAALYAQHAKGGIMRRVAGCTDEQKRWYAAGAEAVVAALRQGASKYQAEAQHLKFLAGPR